jgi:hypothetical protein
MSRPYRYGCRLDFRFRLFSLFIFQKFTEMYAGVVTPEMALKKQIDRYRKMTGEQRLALALDLHEMSCEVAREGIRRQYPEADAVEVERQLRHRLALARGG